VLSGGSVGAIGARKPSVAVREGAALGALRPFALPPKHNEGDVTATRATLRHAAAEAQRVTDADRTVGMLLLPGTTGHRTLLVERDGGKPVLPGIAIRALLRLLRFRGPFFSPDVRREGPSLAAVARAGVRAVAAVPFRLHEAEGCLAVVSDAPRRLDEKDIDRLQDVAQAASISAAIAEEVLTSERHRIARHLHDAFGQTLTSIVFAIDGVEAARSEVKKQALARVARSSAMQAVRELRAVIDSILEPETRTVEDTGTMTELIRHFAHPGMTVRFTSGCKLASLSPGIRDCIYQVAREALLNVKRHSGAKEAEVIVERRAGGVELIISDDGAGIRSKEERQPTWGGFGLRFMKERVEEIGGSLVLQSVPGHGTRVIARLP